MRLKAGGFLLLASATRFATMESAMKTNVLQTTNVHPASPATQLVVSWILPKKLRS